MSRNKALALFLLGAVGCATAPEIYPSHPLVDEIVKVRPGHAGTLTNRAEILGPDGKSTVAVVTEYPLHDPAFRDTVNKLDFLCNIGGKRYKICKDKPGFCRIGSTRSCAIGPLFCKDVEAEIDYIPVDNYQFLLDAKARCASKQNYNLWSQADQ